MKEYFEHEGLNYSTLSALDTNYPGNVFKEDKAKFKTTPAMLRGSLVDCMLTSPDDFDKLYIVDDIPILPESMKLIFTYMAYEDIDYTDEQILLAAKEANYGKSWKDETILKKLKIDSTKKFYDVYKELRNTKKDIITQVEYDKALNVIHVLKNHEFSSWIFTPQEGVEVYYQLPLYWEENNTPCKALLDILIVDHNNKLIRPIDLKVKSDSKYAFKGSFMRYKYYLLKN